jgi:hypothetical protein
MHVTWQIRQAVINPTQQGPWKVQQGRTFQASLAPKGSLQCSQERYVCGRLGKRCQNNIWPLSRK